MVCKVVISKNVGVIEIDGVSFNLGSFSEARIEGGHPGGPVFRCGVAKAVISVQDAIALVAAGVTDKR